MSSGKEFYNQLGLETATCYSTEPHPPYSQNTQWHYRALTSPIPIMCASYLAKNHHTPSSMLSIPITPSQTTCWPNSGLENEVQTAKPPYLLSIQGLLSLHQVPALSSPLPACPFLPMPAFPTSAKEVVQTTNLPCKCLNYCTLHCTFLITHLHPTRTASLERNRLHLTHFCSPSTVSGT